MKMLRLTTLALVAAALLVVPAAAKGEFNLITPGASIAADISATPPIT